MQVFKKLRIIGIDHGYSNIKTANTVMPTGVSVFETEPTFEGNVLYYNGRYYRFGEGHKPFISDKTEDNDFYAATLLGIAKELSREKTYKADIHIAAGLPITWVKNQRESFREYLMKNPDVIFRYKKNLYKIHIAGCSIYPQGYAAYIAGGGVSIMKNFAEFDFEKVVLIEDICAAAKGYETICLNSLRRGN